MSSSEQEGTGPHITKQSAQGCRGKGIRPYTINTRSASRHHTDLLGGEHRQGEGLCGSSSSASRLRDVIQNRCRLRRSGSSHRVFQIRSLYWGRASGEKI